MTDPSTSDLIALRPFLLKRAARFGLSRHDAEDVAQDVLLTALAKGGALRGDDLRAWCSVVLRNRILGIRQSAEYRRTERLGDEENAHTSPAAQEHVVLLGEVGAVLATMPARAARLIRSVSIEGHSLAEAAQAEGVPIGTLKSGLHRAQALLRRKLEARPAWARHSLPLSA
jgi:RNA polymerase sigma-70 factor (ECF subfamily)